MKITEILHQISDRVRMAARITALTGGTKAIDGCVITVAGTGYSSAPAVSFSGGTGSGATATATVGGGGVLSITMTANGTGYTSTVPTVVFGGPGSGAAAVAQMLALDLDAIPTVSIGLTTLPAPFVQFILSGHVNTYRLRAGTDAESSPYIIRPDDYAASTNEKVWELVGFNPAKITRPIRTLTYAGTTDLDFTALDYRDIALTGNITFTTSNRVAGRQLIVRISADGSSRNFTFPSWIFLTATAPASIAANKRALLKLTCYGTADTDIVAEYLVEP